jgi:hypothetical protein
MKCLFYANGNVQQVLDVIQRMQNQHWVSEGGKPSQTALRPLLLLSDAMDLPVLCVSHFFFFFLSYAM